MERITYTTEDGTRIVGSYFEGVGERGAILLHMMRADRTSFDLLAKALQGEGFDVLAIDLRGHGESVRNLGGLTLDYRDFTDEELQDSRLDVVGARDYLEKKGITLESIAIGGASFGANIALDFMADNQETTAGFLLSPGLEYHGLETLPLIERLGEEQAIYIAAAKDDMGKNNARAFEEAEELHKHLRGERELRIFETGGHGTDILLAHPELPNEIAGWLDAAMLL